MSDTIGCTSQGKGSLNIYWPLTHSVLPFDLARELSLLSTEPRSIWGQGLSLAHVSGWQFLEALIILGDINAAFVSVHFVSSV